MEIENKINIEKNKNIFLNNIIGKTINNALDIGLRAILPDLIENQVINIKNELIEQIRAAVPVDRQLCQLVERPAVLGVAAAELLDVEIRLDRVRVYVQTFCEKILALLRVVLRLQAVV